MTADVKAVQTAAFAADDAGLCPILPRTDGSKAPLSVPAHGPVDPASGQRKAGWELFQSERPNRLQIEAWFDSSPGVGLVCGAVSGQLEMLELEGRAVSEGVLDQLTTAAEAAGLTAVLNRVRHGYTEYTPSGGLHWLLRVSDGPALGSLKLAQRLATPTELAEHPKSPIRALIETKGEGGFVVVAPSNGTTHPSGGSWVLDCGGFDTIATVTVAERNALYDVCRTLDRLERNAEGMAKVQPVGLGHRHHRYDGGPVGESWMDAVEAHLGATDSLADALERYGWRDLNRTDSQGCALYERPGQEEPDRNGGLINKSGRLAVFSTSTPFESVLTSGRTYNLLDVYAAYEHQGDRQAAAHAIAEQTGIYAAWLRSSSKSDETARDEGDSAFAWEHAPDPFRIPSLEWLVRGLWSAGTHGELAGPEKTLKSYVGLILDVGLAAGLPVLGQFDVAAPRPVLHFAGEGGRAGYWRRFGRICAAYGVAVDDVRPNLRVTFNTAPLNSPRFTEAVRAELDTFGPALAHLDPYYAFAPGDTDSKLLTSVGPALEVVRVLCAEFDTSLLINNHFNQTGSGNGLTRITGAGHSEWSDSWLLMHHRETPDVAGGRFRLRLDVGSRQWGGTSWDLDLDVGRFNDLTGEHDGTIKWRIEPATVGAAPDPQSTYDAKVEQAKLDHLKVARRKRKPFTRSELIDGTAGTAAVKRVAFDQLVESGSLIVAGTVPVPRGTGTRQVTVYSVAQGLTTPS